MTRKQDFGVWRLHNWVASESFHWLWFELGLLESSLFNRKRNLLHASKSLHSISLVSGNFTEMHFELRDDCRPVPNNPTSRGTST